MSETAEIRNTTLCYLEKDGCYLMQHRTKKKVDENKDKWVGIGGKIEAGESPFDGARREILEETGMRVEKLCYRGLVTFVSDEWGTEYMHLFTGDAPSKELIDCDEGENVWVKKEEVPKLPIWEGDRIFLSLLQEDAPLFFLTLRYQGDRLISHTLEYAR